MTDSEKKFARSRRFERENTLVIRGRLGSREKRPDERVGGQSGSCRCICNSRRSLLESPQAGSSFPPLEAFVADRAHGFDPSPWLPRGRTLTLPVLDSIEDLPIDLADCIGDRPAVLLFYQGGWSRPCNQALFALPGSAFRVRARRCRGRCDHPGIAQSCATDSAAEWPHVPGCHRSLLPFRQVARARLQASNGAAENRARLRCAPEAMERGREL